MERFAVWLFKGWARPALSLLTLAIAVQVIWQLVGHGVAACLGMMGLTLFAFLKALDRLAHVTDEEREARRAATQRRRSRKTAFWRAQLEAKRAREKQEPRS